MMKISSKLQYHNIPPFLYHAFLKWLVFMAIIVVLIAANAQAVSRQEYVDNLVRQADQYSRQKGKQTIAIAYINEAIKVQPRRTELYYKRAFIFGRAGQYSYAIKQFNRFVNNKSYPHAIRFRGDCFFAIRDYPRAAADYSLFLGRNSRDGKVWSYLVEALALMGKKDDALVAARKGLATGSHWEGRLRTLQSNILMGKKITPHKPLSN